MKKFLLLMSLLFIPLLVACSAGSTPPEVVTTPTLSEDDLQTQIAQMLTQLPNEEGAMPQASATPDLPTVESQGQDAYPVPGVQTATPMPAATNTPQPEQPTPTTAAEQPTATAEPTQTATQAQSAGPTATISPDDPRTRLGAPSSTDPMNDEFAWIWPTGSDDFSSASFGSGTQTITALSTKDGWRLANPMGREFTNMYLEATIKTNACTGSDRYGLFVRVPDVREPDQGYLFGVTCDGRFSLRRWNSEVGTKGEMKMLINWTASPAINSGSNQVNRLGIFTYGNRLILFVNGQRVGEATDNTFASGYFGVFLGSSTTPKFNIQVDEMSYWENVKP